METKAKRKSIFGSDVDMLNGKLPSSIIVYIIPLVLTSMLQMLYNAADKIVVSNFSGTEAIAAVGASSPIVGLLVGALIGMSTGVNIILSRYVGAGDKENSNKTVTTAFYFALFFGLIMTAVAQLVTVPLLALTDCPLTIRDKSESYLRIFFSGIPATLIYNFMSSVLRIKGDSRRPFIYLATSGIVNIVLNVVLVVLTPMDVEGVAIATVVSQYLSVIMLLVRLTRLEDEDCRLDFRKIREYDFKIMGKIVRYGLPAAISSATFAVANLQIQSAINWHGDAAIAGNTAAADIESLFLFSVTNPIGIAAATFIGQNIGANNRERVNKLIKYFYVLAFLIVGTFGATICLLWRPMLMIYLSDAGEFAMEFARTGLLIRMGTGFLYALLQVTNGILQAYGYTNYQMVNSLIFTVGVRVFWMSLIYPLSKTAVMIYICYPISWACVFIGGLVMALRIIKKYKNGVEFKL